MDRTELVRRMAAGESFEWLFFWGHTPKPTGRVDASCLSQWYVAPFELEGVRYPTAEHFMMAEKLLFKLPTKATRFKLVSI